MRRHEEKQTFIERWDNEASQLTAAVEQARSISLMQLSDPACNSGAERNRLLQELDVTLSGLRQQLTETSESRLASAVVLCLLLVGLPHRLNRSCSAAGGDRSV